MSHGQASVQLFKHQPVTSDGAAKAFQDTVDVYNQLALTKGENPWYGPSSSLGSKNITQTSNFLPIPTEMPHLSHVIIGGALYLMVKLWRYQIILSPRHQWTHALIPVLEELQGTRSSPEPW